MTLSPNPYVGPRTFTEREAGFFFGREREARDLTARIVSERLLLFYAQSGAGKSSLLNARIIPNLRDEEGFQVLPVSRVSGELPAGLDRVGNIFVFNLIAGLDQSGAHPDHLAQVSLSDFLARLGREAGVDAEGRPAPRWVYRPEIEIARPPAEGARPSSGPRFVLIIDQFEEIITSHPGRWKEREAFFDQLNQALLDDPNLWVVLTLREDYVAALDPYAERCFNRLRARFYMERMKVEAALEAIQRPAEKAGRTFGPGVARQLADNLRQVRVPGQQETVAGQYVEPVQLQVVCFRLWENISNRSTDLITSADLAEAGDVDWALTEFYEATLASVLTDSSGQGPTERQLREWFDKELITEAGTRDSVFRNEVSGYTGSIPNSVVDLMVRRFLLRAELRSGGTWVELVHDRLVHPIGESNALWAEQRLSPLQRHAALWQQEGRPEEMLLKGRNLDEAEQWAKTHSWEMETHDHEFLAASRRERAKAAYLTRQAHRLRLLAIGASLLSLLAVVAALLAWRQSIQTEKARQDALIKEAMALEAKEDAEVQRQLVEAAKDDTRRAEELAIAAKDVADDQRKLAEIAAAEARQAERKAQTEVFAGTAIFELSRRRFDYAELMVLAAREREGQPNFDLSLVAHAIRRVFEESLPNKQLSQPGRKASFTGWLESGKYQLLTTGDTIRILDGDSHAVVRQFSTPERRLRALDATGERLVLIGTGSDSGSDVLEIWSLDQQKPALVLKGHTGQVYSAVWSPDGTKVISGSEDRTARVWDAATGKELLQLEGHNGAVRTVGWSPDGAQIFTGAWDGTSRLWDARTGDLTATLKGPQNTDIKDNAVDALAWSSIDGAIYIGYDDATIQAWYPAMNGVMRLPPAHNDRIRSIVLRPEAPGQFLSLGSDGLAVLWDASVSTFTVRYSWHACSAPGSTVAWHPDGIRLLIGCEDGMIRLWSLEEHPYQRVLNKHDDWVWGVAWSPDGRLIATGGQDKTVRIWDATTGTEVANSGKIEGDYAQALDVTWRPDSAEVLSGHYDGVARLWQPGDGRLLAEFKGHGAGSQGGVWAVAWDHNGTHFVTGGRDGNVLVWARNKPEKPEHQFAQLSARVSALAWSPDDHLVAIGSDDGYLRIGEIETNSIIVEINTQSGGTESLRKVSSIAWYFRGSKAEVALGLSDGFVQIWNPLTSTLIRELQVASGGVEDLAWSPDGGMLVTGSWDGTARVWDTVNWNEVTELEGHTAVVQSVDWSPDGSRIVTGSRDKTARIWLVDNDLMLAALLRRMCTGNAITDADIRAVIPTWSSCEQRLAEPALVRLLERYDRIVGRQSQ